MRWKGWEKVPLTISDPAGGGSPMTVEAIAPLIVSASRATDIPAFYGDWFMDRLAAGYVKWQSPFSGTPVYVSLAKARVFVFWSKNPGPFLSCLDALDRAGNHYYFQFTLNDYETEGFEPGIPPLAERIDTFIRLSRRIGKGRVVWRLDPLILSGSIAVDDLLEKARRIGNQIAPYTERMVFSPVVTGRYAKVRRNLQAAGASDVREFTGPEIDAFCSGLAALNRRWGISLSACAGRDDLSRFGILPGQCISYALMIREFGGDRALMAFLHQPAEAGADPEKALRDPGQRNACRCIVSKDIGQYSTCMHLCTYCYANTSPALVRRRYARYQASRRQGRFSDSITG